ncbi:MAG TPA: enoyl-CoA hydratase family protein [Sporichthyaceae bacterium]|nr:enoyl-CoA hydratase family protein [Sporichthyaceae bacterium]
MGDEPLVLLHVSGALATVTLNAPEKRNALSVAMLTAISEALAQVETDPTVRVVVLTHSGTVFCAGVDMKEASAVGLEASSGLIVQVLRQIAALPKPVVVRLAGPVRAGGLGIVGAADVVIAADDITFAFSEARIGVAPAIISLTVLPRMTPRQAHRWCLTGETFDAPAAVAAGLISQAVPAAELDAAVTAVTAELLLASPQGLAETKKLLGRQILDLLDTAGEEICKLSASLFASDEAKEGMTAFLERRKPRWQS